MLSKILSTAILAIVAWMSMQLLHTHKALDSTQAAFYGELSTIRSELGRVSEQTAVMGDDVLARMDVLSAEQVKLSKTTGKKVDSNALKAKNKQIIELKELAALQNVFTTVLEADLAGVDKEGEKASQLLLSTKTAVWKASDKFPNEKDALRGLMAPIDILSGRWKRGDFQGDTKKIQEVLRNVIKAQSPTAER